MAVKKRVKVSRNKKKNWNKHCDIQDVEEYLEEKRFEERIGGRVSEKQDEELFVVQKIVDEHVVGFRKPKLKKTLRCFQNIEEGFLSKVPPIIKRKCEYTKRIKREFKKKIDRYCEGLAAHPQKAKEDVKDISLFDAELCDLWAEDNKEVDSEMKDLITYHEEMMDTRTPNIPKHRSQKPSLLPAVEVPHAGASYNPSYIDHQELLQEAFTIEKKKEKQSLHLKRVLDDMFPSKKNAPTQESILEEMSQGLFDNPDDKDEEPETLFSLRNPKVSFENRITKSKRLQMREKKVKEAKKAQEKLNRKRMSEVYRIKRIKREIKKEDETSEKRKENRLKRKQEELYKPQTLSKHKYAAPDLEIKLSDELTGSLRTLKPEGDLLEDRYKSLQRRNIIETRVRVKRKRSRKLKIKEKRHHREFQ